MPDQAEVVVAISRTNTGHGANNEVLVGLHAQEVLDELIGKYPWLLDSDEAAVMQFCRAEARARMLHNWAMATAEKYGPAKVKPYVWQAATQAETNAMKCVDRLGLSPSGRAALMKDQSMSMAFSASSINQIDRLRANGRALRASSS